MARVKIYFTRKRGIACREIEKSVGYDHAMHMWVSNATGEVCRPFEFRTLKRMILDAATL